MAVSAGLAARPAALRPGLTAHPIPCY